MVKRDEYIKILNGYKDKPFIKVLTGLRRVGKSTILDLFSEDLVPQGIMKKQILKINFKSPEFLLIKNIL